MARQAGEIRITGTIDEFCFYEMDGEYYVRMKSRLKGKRFWRDKAFEGSRRSCSRFAEGNKIASKVYRMVDAERRVYKLFCFLKRKAISLLRDGMSSEKVETVLVEYMVNFGFVRGKNKTNNDKNLSLRAPNETVPATDFFGARRKGKGRHLPNQSYDLSSFMKRRVRVHRLQTGFFGALFEGVG